MALSVRRRGESCRRGIGDKPVRGPSGGSSPPPGLALGLAGRSLTAVGRPLNGSVHVCLPIEYFLHGGGREVALVDEAHHLLVVVENHGKGRNVLWSLEDPEFIVLVSGFEEKSGRLPPILVDILHHQGKQAAEGTNHCPDQARDQRRVVHDPPLTGTDLI